MDQRQAGSMIAQWGEKISDGVCSERSIGPVLVQGQVIGEYGSDWFASGADGCVEGRVMMLMLI